MVKILTLEISPYPNSEVRYLHDFYVHFGNKKISIENLILQNLRQLHQQDLISGGMELQVPSL